MLLLDLSFGRQAFYIGQDGGQSVLSVVPRMEIDSVLGLSLRVGNL